MFSVKRKLSIRSLGEKCPALTYLGKGLSNKDVAEKCGVPRNTTSTWVKKIKVFCCTGTIIEQKIKTKHKLITNELTTYARAFEKIQIIACA